MRVAILSDIHGNLEALKSVSEQIVDTDRIILLGDIIDYCPHSNEVVSMLRSLDDKVICNIWGNHEEMIMNDDYSAFDLDRGVICAKHTRSQLTEDTITYLNERMSNNGISEFEIEGKKCLAVHGSLADNYWAEIGTEQDYSLYKEYDFVFSGHSHVPHLFEVYYYSDNTRMRNKKKTVFINPGSVGQPRNHCPLSQFAVLNTITEEISFRKVQYDIDKEQRAFSDEVDEFYCSRLQYGV